MNLYWQITYNPKQKRPFVKNNPYNENPNTGLYNLMDIANE
ncbi:MAG: hypothetical protein OFPI_25870 [Osedax symbiont Rs2]|nr:MAG: hypothetical protein OFPI_25870 [Osedax symbiont Rs2]